MIAIWKITDSKGWLQLETALWLVFKFCNILPVVPLRSAPPQADLTAGGVHSLLIPLQGVTRTSCCNIIHHSSMHTWWQCLMWNHLFTEIVLANCLKPPVITVCAIMPLRWSDIFWAHGLQMFHAYDAELSLFCCKECSNLAFLLHITFSSVKICIWVICNYLLLMFLLCTVCTETVGLFMSVEKW